MEGQKHGRTKRSAGRPSFSTHSRLIAMMCASIPIALAVMKTGHAPGGSGSTPISLIVPCDHPNSCCHSSSHALDLSPQCLGRVP